jgi:hypothetical protein
MLLPGLPVREQAALLAGARVAAEDCLSGEDVSGIEVAVSLVQIPEEFRSVAEFVFAED